MNIPTIKLKRNEWDISTLSLFRKAIAESNLISYLEEIKPFERLDYYE